MTAEVVAGIVALVVALVGGAVGWVRVDQHGAEREKRKQAEGKLDEAQAIVEAASAAPASPVEASAILRRRLARVERRLRRLRDEAGRRE